MTRKIMAFEQLVDGEIQPEIVKESEITIYARINDFSGLKAADHHESHLQAQIKSDKGSIRVRRTIIGDEVTYNQTIKTTIESSDKVNRRVETTVDIDQQFFNTFLNIATTCMDKERFTYKSKLVNLNFENQEVNNVITIPELVYHIDVFKRKYPTDAHPYSEWCKIDLEIDPIYDYLERNNMLASIGKLSIKTSNIPLKLTNAFIESNADEQQQQLIKELYEKNFLSPINIVFPIVKKN